MITIRSWKTTYSEDKVETFSCDEIEELLKPMNTLQPVREDHGYRWGGKYHKFPHAMMFRKKHKWLGGDRVPPGYDVTIYDCDNNNRKKILEYVWSAYCRIIGSDSPGEFEDHLYQGNAKCDTLHWDPNEITGEFFERNLVPEIHKVLKEATQEGNLK